MDQDLDQIEEKLKEETEEKKKKPDKVSGRSVLKLQEIIKKKSKEGDDDSRKTLAGES